MSTAGFTHDDAAALMEAYTPQVVTASVWDTFRAVVIALVLRSAPTSARDTRTRAAGLLLWIDDMTARGVLDSPDGVERLLTFARVDQWLREAKGTLPDTARAYYRTQMGFVVEALRPGGWPRPEVIRRWRRLGPYDLDGIDEIMTVAKFAPTLWSDRIERIVSMSFGVGANPADLRRLHTDHIRRHGKSLAVTLTGLQRRTVVMSPRWLPLALKHVDRFDGYWLTGTDKVPNHNFLNRVSGRFTDQMSSPLDVYRMRNTCLVGWINDGLPTHVIRHAAGLSSLSPIDALMEYATVSLDGFPLVITDE